MQLTNLDAELTEAEIRLFFLKAHRFTRMFAAMQCLRSKRYDYNLTNEKLREVFQVQNVETEDITFFREKNSADLPRKHCIYENCILMDAKKNILCHTSNKKLNWYVRYNLGKDLPGKVPRTVMLNFTPKFLKNKDASSMTVYEKFYTMPRKNECVICGSHSSLMKKHVIPKSLMKYFRPTHVKIHSHDVVTICLDCHTDYQPSEIRFIDHFTRINKEDDLDEIYRNTDQAKLRELLQDWISQCRQNFLKSTIPNNLPQLWSLDHPIDYIYQEAEVEEEKTASKTKKRKITGDKAEKVNE